MSSQKVTIEPTMDISGCTGNCGSCSGHHQPEPPMMMDGGCSGDCSTCMGGCGSAPTAKPTACGSSPSAMGCDGDCSSCLRKAGNSKAVVAGDRTKKQQKGGEDACPMCGHSLIPEVRKTFPKVSAGDDTAVEKAEHLVNWPVDLYHANINSDAFEGQHLHIVSLSALAAVGSVQELSDGKHPIIVVAYYPEMEEIMQAKLIELVERSTIPKITLVRTNVPADMAILTLFNYAIDQLGLDAEAELEETVVRPDGTIQSVQQL